MSARRQATGAVPGLGHRISPSHHRIDHRGIDAVVIDLLARGEGL